MIGSIPRNARDFKRELTCIRRHTNVAKKCLVHFHRHPRNIYIKLNWVMTNKVLHWKMAYTVTLFTQVTQEFITWLTCACVACPIKLALTSPKVHFKIRIRQVHFWPALEVQEKGTPFGKCWQTIAPIMIIQEAMKSFAKNSLSA